MASPASGKTDRGRIRPHNEDAMLVDAGGGVFAVADGMGGHAAGEVASQLAIDAVTRVFAGFSGGTTPNDTHQMEELLRKSISEANARIAQHIDRRPEYQGMGTTLVVSVVAGDSLWVAHVGDSRAYLIRDGAIRQLTTDHSFVNELVRLGMLSKEEAARDPRRNVVTRALGSSTIVVPDLISVELQAGDLVLLCSDGLSTMLGDDEILETIRRTQSDIERSCVELIEAANAAGGEDNVTVVLSAPQVEAGTAPIAPDAVPADSSHDDDGR